MGNDDILRAHYRSVDFEGARVRVTILNDVDTEAVLLHIHNKSVTLELADAVWFGRVWLVPPLLESDIPEKCSKESQLSCTLKQLPNRLCRRIEMLECCRHNCNVGRRKRFLLNISHLHGLR